MQNVPFFVNFLLSVYIAVAVWAFWFFCVAIGDFWFGHSGFGFFWSVAIFGVDAMSA